MASTFIFHSLHLIQKVLTEQQIITKYVLLDPAANKDHDLTRFGELDHHGDTLFRF